MFSKSKLLSFSLVLVVIGTGCTREEVPSDRVLKIQGEQECLADAPAQIERYVFGESNDDEVRGFWRCVSSAFTLFKKFVRGEDRNSYKPEELRLFLNMYFLGDVRINDALLHEIMVIKTLLVGGNEDNVLLTELDRAIELFGQFSDWTVRLRPHIGWISGTNRGRRATVAEVEQANVVLREVMRNFGQALAANNRGYQFANLRRFIEEVSALFASGNPNSRLKDLSAFTPLLARLKSILVGPDNVRIASNEWVDFFDATAQFYGIWLRYRQTFDVKAWFAEPSVSQISKSVRQTLDILRVGLMKRPNQMIDSQEIETLFREINAAMTLPTWLSVDKLTGIWNVVSEEILSRLDNNNAADRNFTVSKLDVLDAEYQRWMSVQLDMAKTFNQEMGLDDVIVQLEDWHSRATPLSSYQELIRILKPAPIPFTVDDSTEMTWMKWREGDTKTNLKSLSQVHWEKSAVRLIIRALSDDAQRREALVGVTPDELKNGYLRIKPILVMFGLVEESNTTFYKRILLEGNSFMPHSDGNPILTLEETTGYIQFVLSGLKMSGVIKQEVTNTCPDLTKIDTDCLLAAVNNKYAQFFSQMPNLRGYIQISNQAQRREFVRHWIQVFSPKDETLTSGKLIEASVLLHYLETVMVRFDRNRDGFIDQSEAVNAAYPIFAETLKELLSLLNGEDERRAFFTYLLAYGEVPDPAINPVHEIRFRHWVQFPEKWQFRADRTRVLSVLAALAAFSAN